MEHEKKIILGYNELQNRSHKSLPNSSDCERLEYFSSKLNLRGKLLLALVQYLQQYTKYFDRICVLWPNGTLGQLFKKINSSEVDVGVVPVYMNKYMTERVDFSYPYKLEDYTFISSKPKYQPHISGILQMFSLSVWLTIISVLIAMPIIMYVILRRKYTFNNTSFHVFAIMMRQNSMIKTPSLVEKLLVYSWVAGAMILCLSYECVFLSILSIPPLAKIKTLSDLALAVGSGSYHCIAQRQTSIADYWKNSKHEHLRVIGEDIIQNKLSYGNAFGNFLEKSQKQNLAFILETKHVDMFAGIFFISEDRFFESMSAMMVRKRFCCKDLIDSFVHKIMASGLYFKYLSDGSFLPSIRLKSHLPDPETTNRKLTLTDLAPAFIFLLTGYLISFLVLIFEISSGRKSMDSVKKNKRRIVYDETLV